MTIARTTRAGTRNLVREEIKRVKKQLEKVRKWEKKWVVLEECGLKVYRWVPKPMTATEEKEKKDSPLKAALKMNMNEKYAGKAPAPPKEDAQAPPADSPSPTKAESGERGVDETAEKTPETPAREESSTMEVN